MDEKEHIALFAKLIGEESPARLLFHELAHLYGKPTGDKISIPVRVPSDGYYERFDILLDTHKVSFPGILRLESSSSIVSCSLYQYARDVEEDREPIVKLASGAFMASVHDDDQCLCCKLVFKREMTYYSPFAGVLSLLVSFVTRAEEFIRPYSTERCKYSTFEKARAMLS